MSKLEVFERAPCCPAGGSDVDVDPALSRFNADVRWLVDQGVEVARHSLGHDAAAFAANLEVVKEMHAGMDRLPIATVGGRIVSTGVYPTRAQLAQKLGLQVAGAGKAGGPLGARACAPGAC